MPSRRELANAIRALSMDAVQKAKSGHPGAPMGMADIAEVLWNDFLQHNPSNPHWTNRDRFILSNGHASMLLYSLLHLSGYDLSMEDIKQFRQLHSKTPGHPEYGYAPGIETTTGPLGMGISNAVGMALAEKILAAQFNRDGYEIVDHYTYVFLGDGCLMEGISHESCSLAGTWGLGKLIAFYDDNSISIDGNVKGWFTDDTPKRFESYGWHVIRNVDGHNSEAIRQATIEARSVNDKPSLICCKTIIGYGAPQAGSHDCHGSPLGEAGIAAARAKLGWAYPPFEVPDEIYSGWNAAEKGAAAEAIWGQKFTAYKAAYPELAAEFNRRIQKKLPQGWEAKVASAIQNADIKAEKIATRKASQNAIEAYASILPELLGGSADLTGSNLTNWSGSKDITKSFLEGNYIHYGVREFGMSAIINGITLHGGFIPYGGTFFMFSDYARNAVRMAALMGVQSIFVYTHDSIGLGEDGPTHQAVEQAGTMRYIPRMSVWRPCDTVESLVAWKAAIERTHGPTSLVFSRQGVPHQKRTAEQIENISRGGYVLRDAADNKIDLIIISTGTEIDLAIKAAEILAGKNVKVRVVSMPSTDVFDAQDEAYRKSVLPPEVKARVAVEAAVTDYWRKYVGLEGTVLGIDTFGESGPAEDVYRHFGLTVENLVKVAENLIF